MIRITPAPAGKTRIHSPVHPLKKDHPRTCGENLQTLMKIKWLAGSPPHLRGKRSEKQIAWAEDRITPAPAGKTITLNRFQNGNRDHPRTCGENKLGPANIRFNLGSPPHLRGKLRGQARRCVERRITPAPAGKTLKNDVDTL